MPREQALHKRDIVAAERRGDLRRGAAEELKPTIHRRICPACGESYKPFSYGHRGFCCGCCAYAWGQATDKDKSLRTLAKGLEVVVYETGVLGVIRSIRSEDLVIVDVEGLDEPLQLRPNDVERIQYLVIEHYC